MVIRLGRNGKFLACSTYPDHKETRPLPGEETPRLEGDGETCPQCGEGTLTTKRGRFGAFVGCSRYPDCTYIRKDGPPPPDQLPFEVVCPKNGDGTLVARRARRTGNVFWGCSALPASATSRRTTSRRAPSTTPPTPHSGRAGSVARKGETGLCLTCGATVELPDGVLVGLRLAGGPANPAALERPARGGRRGAAKAGGGSATSGTGARRTTRSSGATTRTGTGSRRKSE